MDDGLFKVHSFNVDATPEEVGYKPDRIERLDALFTKFINDGTLQCANYLMARYGKIFAWRSIGSKCTFEDQGDFMPDSIRRVASITKIFTAVSIMQLIEKGKLFLEKPVHNIISEFKSPMYDRITIFHLLTHTSGIMADPGYWSEPYPFEIFKDLDESNWIKRHLSGIPQCEPGSQWNYSTAGFRILGEIITRASGMPYEDYVTENILNPLGMEHSFFTPTTENVSEICFTSREEMNWALRDRKGRVSAWSAGGGLYSNIHDLWRFGQMVLNKGTFNGSEILSRKTVEAMTRNHLDHVPSYHWGEKKKEKRYGLGFEYDKDPMLSPGNISHEGAGRSALWMDPAEDFIFIYFEPTTLDWSADAMLFPRTLAWSGLK